MLGIEDTRPILRRTVFGLYIVIILKSTVCLGINSHRWLEGFADLLEVSVEEKWGDSCDNLCWLLNGSDYNCALVGQIFPCLRQTHGSVCHSGRGNFASACFLLGRGVRGDDDRSWCIGL